MVLQLFRTQVRLKLYCLWHNEPLYRRTWYYSIVFKRGQVHRSVGGNYVGGVRGRRPSPRVGDRWGLRRSCTLSYQIALSFKSFSEYLVSRHSIPPLTRVVREDHIGVGEQEPFSCGLRGTDIQGVGLPQ